jgi:transposase-like protein
MTKKRNRHTEEFKREAVRLMLSRGERTVGDVARVSVHAPMLRTVPGIDSARES